MNVLVTAWDEKNKLSGAVLVKDEGDFAFKKCSEAVVSFPERGRTR